MSKDKSKLKEILRKEPFSACIELLTLGNAYKRSPFIGTFFDDAAIKFSAIHSSMTGNDVLEDYARSIDAGFFDCPNAHTGIICFDDKTCVPARKAATQGSRREAILATITRNNVPTWTWDGESPIIAANNRPLPPWERVRLDSRAYAHAQRNIVDWLLSTYTPPPGKRILVDSTDGVFIVETTPEGDTLAPYQDTTPKPRIGEADIASLYYARRARIDEIPCGDPNDTYVTREKIPSPLEHAIYYGPTSSAAPMEMRVPIDVTQQSVSYASRRHLYPAGDVLLRSTDTDFIPLGLVEQIQQESSHRIHVCLGVASIDEDGNYCTSSTATARTVSEVYDLHCLSSIVRTFHRAPNNCKTSIWSFIAFCASCGNDYTRRLHGFSHTSLFEAYSQLISDGTRLVANLLSSNTPAVGAAPMLNAKAFMRYIRIAYFNRLSPKNRPTTWTADEIPTWPALSAAVAASSTAVAKHMPTKDALELYFDQVLWSIMYAALGVSGDSYIPP